MEPDIQSKTGVQNVKFLWNSVQQALGNFLICLQCHRFYPVDTKVYENF